MRKLIIINLLVVMAVLLTACGGSAQPTDTTSGKPVNIILSTNPNPAAVGNVEMSFTITDADGNPIEGAKVDVGAEHPSMAGMGMSGAAVEQGGGKYSITADFTDPGTWMLTIYVRKDGLDYKEEIELEIQ